MNRFLLITTIASLGMSLHAEITETAAEAVKNMGLGWNLGNTLDANGQKQTDASKADYWGGQDLSSETYWGQPTTTPQLFSMMRDAGFGAIRVPVTWYNHMNMDGQVDAAWMKRVHEVVDYVIDNGLYCILNVHHDTGADGQGFKSWIKADADNYAANQNRYEYLWKQIAEEFKDYDGKLLFEAYNEMLDIKSSWCYASFNCSGQYDAAIATSAYNGLNAYAQSFVNTVRATGGNNATRNLVVNTYAASPGYGTWSSHLKDVLTNMKLPEDVAEGHLAFEVHTYPSLVSGSSNRSLQSIKSEVDGMISGLNTNLVTKGAPIIFGEWGTSNVDSGAGKTDYDARHDLMLQFVDYFVQKTKENGMATFYWMGLSDGQYRSIPAFSQADLAECMAKAYHGSDFEGVYPELKDMSVVCFDGDKQIGWGNGISIQAGMFKDFGSDVELVLDYQQSGSDDDIQFFYGDWSKLCPFVVDDRTFSGDFQPSSYYNTPDGTEHETVFTFDADTYQQVSQRGLIIHGNSIRLYKATLRSPSSAVISTVDAEDSEDAIYNLAGQYVTNPVSGLYIRGGRKYIAK